MEKRRGLENYKENSGNNWLLLLKPAETRTVRFLQEPSEMDIVRRHWVKGSKYLNCNGDGCPLCLKASPEWGALITTARDYFFAVLIDRSDNKVKVFEGGQSLKDKLLSFSRENSLTQLDFNIRRGEANKGKDLYDLVPIIKTSTPLTKAEKDRISEIDLDRMLKRGEKTNEEMEALIEGIESLSP